MDDLMLHALLGGNKIKKIQRGSAVIADGSTYVDIPIENVDLTKSFVMFSHTVNTTTYANRYFIKAILYADTVNFSRSGNITPVNIEWFVIEFSSGIKVQAITGNLVSGLTTTVSIESVNLNKSFLIGSSFNTGTSSNIYSHSTRFLFSDAANVKIDRESLATDGITYSFFVIEFL